jgi:hypothetical protein
LHVEHSYVRVRSRSGRWLTLHGSHAGSDLTTRTDIAVVIEPALPRVTAGTPSSEIALPFRISAHTVRRGQLVASLLDQRYRPRPGRTPDPASLDGPAAGD